MTERTMTIPLSLAVKLASVAVHAQEFLSPSGHDFDRIALERTAHDPEVVKWVATLGPLAPQKRGAK